MPLLNIYCDESCHLEKDGQKSMTIGAILCKESDVKAISDGIRKLKLELGFTLASELKWTKISPLSLPVYSEFIKRFFADDRLQFRAFVVPDKSLLNHEHYNQTHDDFYYKMTYRLIEYWTKIYPNDRFNLYLDYKDTRSGKSMRLLYEYMNRHKDCINRVQAVNSKEVELLQLADIITGAVSYENRMLSSSPAKVAIVDLVKTHSLSNLKSTSRYSDHKFNILYFDEALLRRYRV